MPLSPTHAIITYPCHYNLPMPLSPTHAIITYPCHYHLPMPLSPTHAIITYPCHYHLPMPYSLIYHSIIMDFTAVANIRTLLHFLLDVSLFFTCTAILGLHFWKIIKITYLHFLSIHLTHHVWATTIFVQHIMSDLMVVGNHSRVVVDPHPTIISNQIKSNQIKFISLQHST